MLELHQAKTVRELAWITGRRLGAELEREPGFAHRVAWAALRRKRSRVEATAGGGSRRERASVAARAPGEGSPPR